MNIDIGPDIPIGCGLHADRVEHLYRTTYPLLAYLKPWGGEFVLMIRDGHILGMVRRDKRPIWQKIRERSRRYFHQRFPRKQATEEQINPLPLTNCCA